MGSIDMSYFLNMSPARLMIKIWEFSHHVHHIPALDPSSCNCKYYLECCIDTAREIWDNENYIILIVPFTSFNFIEKDMCV